MRNRIGILVFTALLCCLFFTAASASSLTTVELNGLTCSIPDMPVKLTHKSLDNPYMNGEYHNSYLTAWKFDTDKRASLQLQYTAFDGSMDFMQYAQEQRLAENSTIEYTAEADHITAYYTDEQVNTFFLSGRVALGLFANGNGIVSIAYENEAMSDEEAMAEVKNIIASLQFTAEVPITTVELTEGTAATLDEAAAVLKRANKENAESITLTCSEELYTILSADSFAALYTLGYENGLTDFRIRYYESDRIIKMSYIEYTDVVAYAEADTLEEAEAAAFGFINNGLANFNLACSSDVYTELLNNRGIYNLLAKLGIQDCYLSYSSNMLLVQDMIPYSVPYAVVDDVYAAANQINIWHEEGINRFAIVFDKKVYESLSNEETELIDFLGGIDRANARTSSKQGSIIYGYYDDVTWTEGQSVYCATEDEIVTAIKVLGSQGSTSFRIMTTKELYGLLQENNFARLHELESLAGMSSSSMSYYFSTPIVVYTDAVIVADAHMLSSLDEVTAYVNECVAKQDSEINLFLTADVYNSLMSGLSYFQIGKSNAKIFDLIANAGIADSDWSYNRNTHIITMKNVQLYAGTRILQAVQNGAESSLSARDQETLAEARRIADACKADSELNTLKNIHDVLCQMIVYTDDENTDEDDCAIGAIMNGEANCDGYADALYLIGHLSGLDVRYQHGDSVKQGLGSMFATHMWNVVKIDGTWRLVDVTWDDQKDDAPIYAWFNIGEDRAAKTHVWSREMTVAMDPCTDTSARYEVEYIVTTADDVKAAVIDAESNGLQSCCLYNSEDSALEQMDIINAAQEAITGAFSYMWLDGLNCMRIVR